MPCGCSSRSSAAARTSTTSWPIAWPARRHAELLRRNGREAAGPRPAHPAGARHQARASRSSPPPTCSSASRSRCPAKSVRISSRSSSRPRCRATPATRSGPRRTPDPEVARLLRLNGRRGDDPRGPGPSGPGVAAGGPAVLSSLRSLPDLLRRRARRCTRVLGPSTRCWPCPSRPGPSPSPGWPACRRADRSSWPYRPRPTPSAWPTTWPPSWATTRSSCSRRGRRCPSSGSARASRPWAGGCARSGASRGSPSVEPPRRGHRGAGAGAGAAPRAPRRARSSRS